MGSLRPLLALLGAALFGLLLLGAAPELARAQDEGAVNSAREHMERGQRFYLQGRFLEAAVEFDAAYEALHSAAFLYNAAVAYERGGRAESAIRYFERYLEADSESHDRDEVRHRIDALRHQMEEQRHAREERERRVRELQEAAQREGLEVQQSQEAQEAQEQTQAAPPTEEQVREIKGLVSVRSDPEGARVVIRRGNEEVTTGEAPFACSLDAGNYTVVVSHPDFQETSQDVELTPGQVVAVVANLRQGELFGHLQIRSNPDGAEVYIDDRGRGVRGHTPFEVTLPTGNHRILLVRRGFLDFEREVEIRVSQTETLETDLERAPTGRISVRADTDETEGATVYLDGEELGEVPFEGEVVAGPHHIRVVKGGMKMWEEDFEVARGRLTLIHVQLEHEPDRASAWATAVFATLFVGAGAILGVVAFDLQQQLEMERDRGVLATDDPRIDEGFFYYLGADAAFTLGLILGIASLVSFVSDGEPPSRGDVREPREYSLLPTFLPTFRPDRGEAGATLRWSF